MWNTEELRSRLREVAQDLRAPVATEVRPAAAYAVPAVKSNEEAKKDMRKRYQVTFFIHSGSGEPTNALFVTEEEAQTYLESTVAQYRAQVTTKTFFTASVLDCKTGEFIGSVSDNPPELKLNGKHKAPARA